jgi:hypothetical protein
MPDARPALPFADVIAEGVADLAAGRETLAALVVAIGAPRLRRQGVALPPAEALPSSPEHRLYRLLAAREGDGAHSAYNALVRRLVSHERALEHLQRERTATRARL